MRELAFAAVVLIAVPAVAQTKAGDLTLSTLQVRASLGANPNTAAYLTIANAGSRPERLLSASCACAAKVEAHATVVRGGVASMAPAGPVAVPPKGSTTFKPGGLHLMVTGLKAPLKDGAVQEMTLRFERAGPVTARFRVVTRVDGGAPAHHH